MIDYQEMVAANPNLRCECRSLSSYGEFASANISTNQMCAWTAADLEKSGVDETGMLHSTCRALTVEGNCNFLNKNCKRAAEVVKWIQQDFNITSMSSTQLIDEYKLGSILTAKLESTRTLPKLIIKSAMGAMESWVSLNIPSMVDAAGDIAARSEMQSLLIAKLDLNSTKHVDTFSTFAA